MKSSLLLIFSFIFLSSFYACDADENLLSLAGKVYKGPIHPVEIIGTDNNAPFSALFLVYDVHQQHLIGTFTSNAEGIYQVMLAPGSYTIVPDVSAPIMQASFQVKQITVKLGDTVIPDLYFDTGIR